MQMCRTSITPNSKITSFVNWEI